jgi:hypothetical protein
MQKDTLKTNVSAFLLAVINFALFKRESKVLHSFSEYLEVVTEQMHQNCSAMCKLLIFFIAQHFTGHPETDMRFQKLMALPAVDTIVFNNVRWESKVKIQPHRGCFHNSLDIRITDMARWTVECCTMCEVRLALLQLHKISGSSDHGY